MYLLSLLGFICSSEVIYKAKKVRSITFQRFHCLTLDVLDKGKKSRTSVQQCLELYFKEEVSLLGVSE
jgi:hypothetical protein